MTSKVGMPYVVLVILDGWGIAKEGPGNAIEEAKTPNFDRLWSSFPHTQLKASGLYVGLPKGEAGNTETGHLNLGAGKVVYQGLERINKAIKDGSFYENQAFLGAIEHVRKNNSKLHLMGLVSSGNVHSSLDHLINLIKLAAAKNIVKTYIHVFTDGRDSSPTSAGSYIKSINEAIEKYKAGKIASIMGRYWSMDRDRRWSRTEKAYLALTEGKGNMCRSPEETVAASYKKDVTDEFIEPSLMVDNNNNPIALVGDNDGVIFFNFRIDRPRQLTGAFVIENFEEEEIDFGYDRHSYDYAKRIKSIQLKGEAKFIRKVKPKNIVFVTMTQYSKALSDEGAIPAFPPEVINMPLGRVLSAHGYKQLRLTESEKERFVTFHFNGFRGKPLNNEERVIIKSDPVATYDKKPEMQSEKITETLLSKIKTEGYKLIVVNYPNADMLGHTGKIDKTIIALEAVDNCIGKVAHLVLSSNGALLITADHGNAEEMLGAETGVVNTEHSANSVPLIIVARKFIGDAKVLQSGRLADVAPTILSILGIPVPSSMLGRNLLGPVI